MEINYAFIIKKLQEAKEIYVPYALATNMPFVTCEEETFNDQVWLFISMDELLEFTKLYSEQKISFKAVKLTQANMREFYVDLHSMGINEVVLCAEEKQYKLELRKLVKLPDFSKTPEKQRPLMNPVLQLSTIYFMQEFRRPGAEQDKEKLNELAEEMYANVAKAKFLMPIQVEPVENGQGKMNLPYIVDKKGNKFQPIFSDHTQYMKHVKNKKPDANTKVLVVGVEELRKYLLKSVSGYMLNPDSYCHVLNGQQLKYLRERFGV